MAQTNVIVTYATVRQPAAEILARNSAPGQRRWSATLAGALLAGGAVFVLGQFVAADGSLRETDFPARPSVPRPEAERVGAAPAAALASVERQPADKPAPLPYLALVRDFAPQPAAAAPTMRALSATKVLATPTVPISAPPPTPEAPRADGPELLVDLAPQSLPPLASGLRRDLEGFLQAQGHELAGPDEAGTLIASAGTLPPAPTVAMQPAEIEQVEPLGTPAGTSVNTVVTLAGVREPTPPVLAVAQPKRSADRQRPPNAAPSAGPDKAAPLSTATVHVAVSAVATTDAPTPSARGTAQSYPLAVVNGEPLGAVTLRDGGASEPAIHVGALLELVRLRMPEAQFARLSGAAAAAQFVTLEKLRAAGIAVQFDPDLNQLVIEAR